LAVPGKPGEFSRSAAHSDRASAQQETNRTEASSRIDQFIAKQRIFQEIEYDDAHSTSA
jgi:hypothetical protein